MTATDDISQVTEWAHPNDKMDTQWGYMNVEAWLGWERARWLDKGRFAEVRTNSEGLVALFGSGLTPESE